MRTTNAGMTIKTYRKEINSIRRRILAGEVVLINGKRVVDIRQRHSIPWVYFEDGTNHGWFF